MTVVTTWAGTGLPPSGDARPLRSAPTRWRARSACQCSRAMPMPRLRQAGSTTPLMEAKISAAGRRRTSPKARMSPSSSRPATPE